MQIHAHKPRNTYSNSSACNLIKTFLSRFYIIFVCHYSLSCVQLFVTTWTVTDSFVHGIIQARILEWVAIHFSRRSSWPKDQTHIFCISCIASCFFTIWATREPLNFYVTLIFWKKQLLKPKNSLWLYLVNCFLILNLSSFKSSWYRLSVVRICLNQYFNYEYLLLCKNKHVYR